MLLLLLLLLYIDVNVAIQHITELTNTVLRSETDIRSEEWHQQIFRRRVTLILRESGQSIEFVPLLETF